MPARDATMLSNRQLFILLIFFNRIDLRLKALVLLYIFKPFSYVAGHSHFCTETYIFSLLSIFQRDLRSSMSSIFSSPRCAPFSIFHIPRAFCTFVHRLGALPDSRHRRLVELFNALYATPRCYLLAAAAAATAHPDKRLTKSVGDDAGHHRCVCRDDRSLLPGLFAFTTLFSSFIACFSHRCCCVVMVRRTSSCGWAYMWPGGRACTS